MKGLDSSSAPDSSRGIDKNAPPIIQLRHGQEVDPSTFRVARQLELLQQDIPIKVVNPIEGYLLVEVEALRSGKEHRPDFETGTM